LRSRSCRWAFSPHGAQAARAGWSGFSVWAERIPYISAGIVALIGAIVTFKGLSLLGLV